MQLRPLHEYTLFAEAWCWLALARLSLLIFPFKHVAKWMASVGVQNQQEYSPEKLTALSVAILRASRYSPWRTKCFEQALCARKMLNTRGLPSQIFFGVRKNPENGNLEAHAWTKSNTRFVTGSTKEVNFKELLRF